MRPNDSTCQGSSTMRFTVIGASGFIGSRLASFLHRMGHDVSAPQRGSVILDEDLGHVIYCAGVTSDFRTRPYDTVSAHVSYLAELLKSFSFSSFLYLSSTRVYLGARNTSEDAACVVNPNVADDLYNLTKLTGESLCFASGRGNVRVARLSNLFDADLQSQSFLGDLLSASVAARSITLRTSLESAKDYVCTEDVLVLLYRIAMEGKQQLYNVASGENLSNRELIGELVRLTGADVRIAPQAPTVVFPVIDVDRISGEFFRPSSKPLKQLQRIIQDLRDQNDHQD